MLHVCINTMKEIIKEKDVPECAQNCKKSNHYLSPSQVLLSPFWVRTVWYQTYSSDPKQAYSLCLAYRMAFVYFVDLEYGIRQTSIPVPSVDNFCLQYYLVKHIPKLFKKCISKIRLLSRNLLIETGRHKIFHEIKESVQCVNYSLVKILILKMYIILYLYPYIQGLT